MATMTATYRWPQDWPTADELVERLGVALMTVTNWATKTCPALGRKINSRLWTNAAGRKVRRFSPKDVATIENANDPGELIKDEDGTWIWATQCLSWCLR